MIVGGLLAFLLLIGFGDEAEASPLNVVGVFALQAAPGDEVPGEVERIYEWEQDLRWFAFQLLKDIRRYAIRTARLIRRSADYWVSWFSTGAALLLFGALVSSVDRRLLTLRRERGNRVAFAYAWVGVVVFLRLLRDRRIPAKVRWIVPLAVLYGICASAWLDLGSRALDLANQLLVMGVAARSFVRRCPDPIVEQHASYARERALARLSVSSSEGP